MKKRYAVAAALAGMLMAMGGVSSAGWKWGGTKPCWSPEPAKAITFDITGWSWGGGGDE